MTFLLAAAALAVAQSVPAHVDHAQHSPAEHAQHQQAQAQHGQHQGEHKCCKVVDGKKVCTMMQGAGQHGQKNEGGHQGHQGHSH